MFSHHHEFPQSLSARSANLVRWLARTVNEWIPCSERLPEDIEGNLIECYLVTDGFLQWMAYYNSEIGWQFAECTNSRNKIDWTEVIAWQPLPQPYKGE